MGAVIKVENLSKQYRLGDVGTGSLKDDFKRFRYRMMGKEDPFLQVGDVNERTKKSHSNYVWALKDINFEIEQGDVVGIIGRNGAGKSTLLKILSRTTAPTTGSVKIKGRIASLLEVGTGFHGELSGRENIYLNGAIMGLRKWEIDKKLDEIIDFAGVEKYLDTPVKRYSSGMYVRLAFAVAAHLDPDILIVDEVLAVGDAEFQRKCLGKMKEVSVNQGRTVIFVSHNLQAIQKLCSSCIYLDSGLFNSIGDVENILNQYLKKRTSNSLQYFNIQDSFDANNLKKGFVHSLIFEDLNDNQLTSIEAGRFFQIRIKYQLSCYMEHFIIAVGLVTSNDIPLYTAWSKSSVCNPGVYEAVFINDAILFASGQYRLSVGLSNNEVNVNFIEDIIEFQVSDLKTELIKNDNRILRTSGSGLIINPIDVKITQIN